MSNYTAMARLKGTDHEWHEAVFIDNYYGPRKYGVRFRGTTHFLREDEVEVAETTIRRMADSKWQSRRR